MTLGVFALVLTAALCHALWNFAARNVEGNFVILWLALCAGCLLFFPVVAAAVVFHDIHAATRPAALWYVIATGVIHSIYFTFLSRAYEYGEISVVYPIARGSGIGLTAIIAGVVLREGISPCGAGGITLIFIGVTAMGMAVGRRSGGGKGYGFALCVGLTITAYSLVDKVGVSTMNPILYLWFMIVITVLLLVPRLLARYRGTIVRTARDHTGVILMIGIVSLGTYLMILFAYTLAPVSYVIALREFAVVIGAVLGFLLLKETVTPWKITAITLIVGGMLLIRAA